MGVISAWTISSYASRPGQNPTPSSIRKAIAISSIAQSKTTLSNLPPKKMQPTKYTVLKIHSCIVAHALVRAASRLVSTLACELVSITNKRRDESRRRRPGACATSYLTVFAKSSTKSIAALLAFTLLTTTASALTPKQRQDNINSFEYVWTAIRDN